ITRLAPRFAELSTAPAAAARGARSAASACSARGWRSRTSKGRTNAGKYVNSIKNDQLELGRPAKRRLGLNPEPLVRISFVREDGNRSCSRKCECATCFNQE